MAMNETLSASAAWAARITPRHYKTHRAELDELVVAAVPAYAKSVHARLNEFAASVAASRETYDRNHSAPQFIRPWRVRWAQNALLWAYLLGILISFGLMYPIGGRSVGNINYDSIDWALAVMLSSIFFVVGVMAQLARRFPIVPGVPPRTDLAWLPTVFGVPTIVMMIINFTAEENVQPGWIVLTGAAILVSVFYCLTRLVQRSRNPALTRLVDTSEETRLRAAAKALRTGADRYADLIEGDFAALPDADQSRLRAELDAATKLLQQRGYIRVVTPLEEEQVARREIRRRRPMVPGFLLLERKVQELWDPYFSEPGSRMGITWHAFQYLPIKKR